LKRPDSEKQNKTQTAISFSRVFAERRLALGDFRLARAARVHFSAAGAGSTGFGVVPIRKEVASKQKIPLRHRQLVGRLADEEFAVGGDIVGSGVDFGLWRLAIVDQARLARNLRRVFSSTDGAR
jgi:hypothetical protein